MREKKYSDGELLLKILQADLEREKQADELAAELDRLEFAEIRDSKRIDEIVEELEILIPFPDEEDEDKIINVPEMIKGYKRKHRLKLMKIISSCTAVFIFIILSTQMIAALAFDIDFFGWTKNIFLSFIGVEVRQENVNHAASDSNKYNTIEELEIAENIEILVPTWLPYNINFTNIEYSFHYTKKQINLYYSDDMTSLIIKLNSTIPNSNEAEIYKNENIIFYIFNEVNVIWWEYNGDFYNLYCGFDISGCAEEIIKNIK